MQISHQNLKTGSIVKITNPKNNESLVFKNIKRIRYPEFYKILITKPVAEKLSLNKDLPILEITELKKINHLLLKKLKFLPKKRKFHQRHQWRLYKSQIFQNIKKKVKKKFLMISIFT